MRKSEFQNLGGFSVTNKNDNCMEPVQAPKPELKKPYQTPELTVHGRVNQITKFLLAMSHH